MWEYTTLSSGMGAERKKVGSYCIDLVRNGSCLVVPLEPNLTKIDFSDPQRQAWGEDLILNEGHSLLGIKPSSPDWFRGAELHAFIRGAEFQALCAEYRRVVFYGSSMGAYAALAFASAVPGAVALAHCPQSTLDSGVVPWEVRFPEGRAQDWTGDFRDLKDCVSSIHWAAVTYDPFCRADVMHIRRLAAGPNIQFVRVPFGTHNVAKFLSDMDALKPMLKAVIDGSGASLSRYARNRRSQSRYYEGFAMRVRAPVLRMKLLKKAVELEPGRESAWLSILRLNYQQGAYLANERIMASLDLSTFTPVNRAKIDHLMGLSRERLRRFKDKGQFDA